MIAALLLGAGGTASALAAGSTQVRIGQPPPPASAVRTLGALQSTVRMHVTVVLKPRGGLAAYAREVSTPGSSVYHDYLTPAQFAARFGATPVEVQSVDASLRAHGLTPGPVTANRLAVPVSATAGQVERGFSVSLRRVALRTGRVEVIPNAAPAVDRGIAAIVQGVVGLSSLSAPKPLLVRSRLASGLRSLSSGSLATHLVARQPHACGAASSKATADHAYTADQIASAYGLSGLYAGGAEGQGQTIAVYELESFDPSDIAAYQTCYGTDAPVTDIAIDGGGSGGGPGSGEAALDIEQVIGLAPRAKVLVYEGPNSDRTTPGSGPYDTLNAIVAQDRAQVVSTSWGNCEQAQGADALSAESSLFQEAAAQGQSVLAAAGDNGSEDCNGVTLTGDTDLAVDDPGSQPFVTAVGGTTLTSAPRNEVVWNDYPNSGPSDGAGGGGVSQAWPMPGYQSHAASSLNVIGPDSSGSSCAAPSGFCRQVPDVSAGADPAHGYVTYFNGAWGAAGGTSASAPLWAALIADANSTAACKGSAIGFANPALYQAAGTAYASRFNDITSGNNDFTGLQSGLYPAGTGYDLASGLGTPKAGVLAAALCADALRVDNPGTQLSTVGEPVSLRINTTGPGAQLRFDASQLPPGLAISATTGRITGRPARTGTWLSGVAALDQNDSLRGTFFWWRVVGAPNLSSIALSGVVAGHPKLTFTVSAGRGAPSLKAIWIRLPHGLRFAAVAGRVRIVGKFGRRIRFSSRLIGGRLQVLLAAPAPRLRITLASKAVRTSAQLASKVRHHRHPALTITVTTKDTAGQVVMSWGHFRALR